MGEARRRAEQGLPPRQSKTKQESSWSKLFSWLPKADSPREQFYSITKRGAWIGIGLLAVLWIVVRFVGPAAGWWIPADG